LKRIIVYTCLVQVIFLIAANFSFVWAFGSEGCDSDCSKCHSFTQRDAEEILKELKFKNSRVLNISISPAKGLWELVIEENGKKGVLYVDFAKKHMLSGPIIEIATGTNKSLEDIRNINDNRKVDISNISLKNDLVIGNPRARNKVIVFTDPECPFCAKLHKEMKKIVAKRKDIAFYLKLFPLSIHKDSYWKSVSIVCKKSIALMEDNFAKKPISRHECNTGAVKENISLAGTLGITSTPTIILPDGRIKTGAISSDKLADLIDGSK
jgi:thiol:disulfide interchange protein DsbC